MPRNITQKVDQFFSTKMKHYAPGGKQPGNKVKETEPASKKDDVEEQKGVAASESTSTKAEEEAESQDQSTKN